MKHVCSVRWLIVLTATLAMNKAAFAQPIVLKAGQVSQVTGRWKSVSLGPSFTDPIVIVGPLSNADSQPALARVRNVTSRRFQVQVQEWDSQDGAHGAERLSYVAVVRGRYVLSNGQVMVAESTSVTGGDFQDKTFSQPFTTAPIIIATVVTQNEVSAVAVQIRNVTTTGFQIRLREQEANTQSHVAETVHFLAWEPGVGTINELDYEVGTRGVNNAFSTLWFAAPFAVTPMFLAGSQTVVGAEAYAIRHKTATRARAELKLQEDGSSGLGSFHATETVGYLALGPAGPPGVEKDATFLAMGDSITFGLGDTIRIDDFRDGALPPGGYPPVLTRAFKIKAKKNVLFLNEGIPGDRSADGLADVSALVNAYALTDYVLLLYGANDAGFDVPSGAGLSPEQPGYSGSFKANMQQMIDVIHNAGKTPVLAKVLYQANSNHDPLIQQYNQAIDELVAQKGAPDFYAYFKAQPGLLPDGLHPNGRGYKAMAQLWYDFLIELF